MSYLSEQMKVQRMHRSNATRWMHNSDDIIPISEPDHMSLKDTLKVMLGTFGMMILLFLVWWYRG